MMNKSILSVVVLGTLAVSSAVAQIPPGFEIVQITNDPDYDGPPKINNCGEIVFSKRINQSGQLAEIFVYDNGRITRLTDDYVPDAYPDINDAGTVAWTRHAGNYTQNVIVMFPVGGEPMTVGFGEGPAINNLGHVAWQVFTPGGCTALSAIHLYDGEIVEEIIDDGLSNQVVQLNDHDQLVWSRYDDCAVPYESDVMLYSDNVTRELTDKGVRGGAPSINNHGQIAWQVETGPDGRWGLVLWENDETVPITDWGWGAHLNNLGDIAFYRWHDENSTWQTWVYRGGDILQITDDSTWNWASDMNDLGEIVWPHGMFPETDIFVMRRIRNGDVDSDGNTALDDFAGLGACITGPVEVDRLCECRLLDLDHDRDVDLRDFASFQNLFTGEDS